MTVTGKDKIEIIEKDPEGEEGLTFGSLVYEEENLLEKLLEKISSKETYLLDIVPDEALLWMV